MTVAIRTAHKKINGGRSYQEDYCAFSQEGDSGKEVLAVLADGMGGQGASGSGATASEIACTTFVKSYSDGEGSVVERLGAALEESNSSVAKKKEEAPELGDMGTTLIGATIRDNGLQWVSVGDSHLYLYRNGELRKLNEDHSFVPMLDKLVERGEMTEEEARHHPNRNAIRSAVMGAEIELRDLQQSSMPLQDGDIIILASDGLDTIDGNAIVNIVHESAGEDPEIIAQDLLDAVEAVGKPDQDNTTIMVMSVTGGGKVANAMPGSKMAMGALAALLLLVAAGAAAYFAGYPIPLLNIQRAAPEASGTDKPAGAVKTPPPNTNATQPESAPTPQPSAAPPAQRQAAPPRPTRIEQSRPSGQTRQPATRQQPSQGTNPSPAQQPQPQDQQAPVQQTQPDEQSGPQPQGLGPQPDVGPQQGIQQPQGSIPPQLFQQPGVQPQLLLNGESIALQRRPDGTLVGRTSDGSIVQRNVRGEWNIQTPDGRIRPLRSR